MSTADIEFLGIRIPEGDGPAILPVTQYFAYLEVGEDASQEHDHALALGPRRRAPLPSARALVRDLEFETGEGRLVVVRGLFSRVLTRTMKGTTKRGLAHRVWLI